MKNLKFSLVAVFAALLVFGACGKYEEGPSMSLRSKKARLAGDWKVVKVVAGSVEVSDLSEYGGTTTFDKDGTGKVSGGPLAVAFEWEFSDDKTKIITKTTILGVEGKVEAKILRLTNKELWTTVTDGGVKTETHYEKQ